VVTGAGVGRKRKDKLLMELLKELNIETQDFEVTHNYANTIVPSCKVKEMFLKVKRAHNDSIKPQTFKKFATSVLGAAEYNHFIVCSGYTDYENEDVSDTLYNYGFDDNYNNWIGVNIPWRELIKTLVNRVGANNVKFKNGVTKLERTGEGYNVTTELGDYSGKKIILATTIDSVLKLLPNKKGIYNQIKGQTFLRTYGKFSKQSKEIMKKHVNSMTIVPGPLQKLIPINPDKGIYMIAYSDNKCAVNLKYLSEDNEESRSRFCEIIERSLGISIGSLKLLSIKNYFWPIGTHYYEPLSEDFRNRGEFIKLAQCPENDIRIVGEMISENQGWVEGALESVKAVITKKWIKELK